MPRTRNLVLVADDDSSILRLLRVKLQTEGYQVLTATDGRSAVDLCMEEHPDLVILDVMMPEMDGLEAMRRIRESSSVPIILLTARTSGSEKVLGLDRGADDYVTKPFDPDELAARIAAHLRRASGSVVPTQQVLEYPRVRIDVTNRRVMVDGSEVVFTRTEWEVLNQLASNPGRVMMHAELLSRIWGPEFRDETYYLRTWVSRIRKKLGDDDGRLIRTYPGVGYRLEPPPTA